MFWAKVERVVLIYVGVCLHKKDLREGMFVRDGLTKATSILLLKAEILW